MKPLGKAMKMEQFNGNYYYYFFTKINYTGPSLVGAGLMPE
jgi:hypothetical protein